MRSDVTELTHAKVIRASRSPREVGLIERIALFVCSMHRERSAELLEGFSEAPRQRAETFARQVTRWDSPTRQARLTREFGVRPDAADRLKALVVEAPPTLRHAIVAHLPVEWRAMFPHLAANHVGTCPALEGLAARLVREATRT